MPSIDFLIVGSGIAGLSVAVKLARQFPDKKVLVVTKQDELNSNTCFAQGGIAAVVDELNDSFEKHITDTLKAGGGLCNEAVVAAVVRQAPKALNELINNGAQFDRTSTGQLCLGIEGGHSRPRVVHFKDMTGQQIAQALVATAQSLSNVILSPHHMVIDLITDQYLSSTSTNHMRCCGAFVLNKERNIVEKYISRFVILATGGVGHAYKVSTNPAIGTGDGIAMAYRAGAEITNMEFVQFHPTVFALKQPGSTHFLITEALRGFGAYIKNRRGERFLNRYDELGELSCRDVVARSIENEMINSKEPFAYLDCTHLPAQELMDQFPGVYHHCLNAGIDITKHSIPVIPGAHYLCGGISVDMNAESSLTGLYAVGECSCTGLHGANRLASNSLLEAVVFAEFCFLDIKRKFNTTFDLPDEQDVPIPYSPINNGSLLATLLTDEVQNLMTKCAGITRTNDDLHYASNYLEKLSDRIDQFYSSEISAELIQLKSIVACSSLIIRQSLERRSNCGVFYNRDLSPSSIEKNHRINYLNI